MHLSQQASTSEVSMSAMRLIRSLLQLPSSSYSKSSLAENLLQLFPPQLLLIIESLNSFIVVVMHICNLFVYLYPGLISVDGCIEDEVGYYFKLTIRSNWLAE